jgi:hypothetical protein
MQQKFDSYLDSTQFLQDWQTNPGKAISVLSDAYYGRLEVFNRLDNPQNKSSHRKAGKIATFALACVGLTGYRFASLTEIVNWLYAIAYHYGKQPAIDLNPRKVDLDFVYGQGIRLIDVLKGDADFNNRVKKIESAYNEFQSLEPIEKQTPEYFWRLQETGSIEDAANKVGLPMVAARTLFSRVRSIFKIPLH